MHGWLYLPGSAAEVSRAIWMTGLGHKATGVGAAFIAAAIASVGGMLELAAAVLAAVSCRLPDQIEMPRYKNGIRAGTWIPHRTITHWPFLWLLVLYAGFTMNVGVVVGSGLVGIAVGALTHILCDAPNPMGIPWFVPHRRLKLGRKGLWRSGQYEYLIVLCYTLFGYIVWRFASGWRPGTGHSFWLPQEWRWFLQTF